MKLVRPPFLSYSSPLFASQLSCLGISASLFLFFLYLFLPLPLTPSIFLFPFLWLLTDLLAERPCSVGPGRAPLLLWLHQESEVRGNCPDAAQAPGFFPGSEARRGNSQGEIPSSSGIGPARPPGFLPGAASLAGALGLGLPLGSVNRAFAQGPGCTLGAVLPTLAAPRRTGAPRCAARVGSWGSPARRARSAQPLASDGPLWSAELQLLVGPKAAFLPGGV